MHGFININKPPGITSFDVIRVLKPCLPRKHKIGHLGTLDPMAGGVLPLAIGHASRLIHYIDDHVKQYTATMTMGAISDTQDAWGRVENTWLSDFQESDLRQVISSFVGRIEQIPPMHSAVHHMGKRLYELARQGLSVERSARKVDIYKIEILSIDLTGSLPRIVLQVECSKGTYIRTLCHDIGGKMGTGALMSQLLRTRSGPFRIEEAVSLDIIQKNIRDLKNLLLPIDYPLINYPEQVLPDGAEKYWRNGRPIDIISDHPGGLVKVYGSGGGFLGMALLEGETGRMLLKPQRVLSFENGV